MAPESIGPGFEDDAGAPRSKPRRRAAKGSTSAADAGAATPPPPPSGEGACDERPSADPATKSAIAKDLSDCHAGSRWQVWRYNPQPEDGSAPGPFAKDIYYGVRKLPDASVAQADKREIEFKNKAEETMSTLKAVYRPPEPENTAEDGILRRIWSRITPAPAAHGEQWLAARCTRFDEAYERLFSIAVLGLATEGNLDTADDALNSLRADVLRREMGAIKNAYMRKLGRPALAAGIVLVLLFLLYDKSPGFFAAVCGGERGFARLLCDPVAGKEFRALFPNEVYEYRAIFLLLAGCMMGTWASFAARKVKLAFSDLAELEQDALAPRMRLLFTGVLTFIFALVFLTGLVHVDIGGFSTRQLAGNGLVAVLMGAFFGLLEQALPAAIMERARGFVETVAAK